MKDGPLESCHGIRQGRSADFSSVETPLSRPGTVRNRPVAFRFQGAQTQAVPGGFDLCKGGGLSRVHLSAASKPCTVSLEGTSSRLTNSVVLSPNASSRLGREGSFRHRFPSRDFAGKEPVLFGLCAGEGMPPRDGWATVCFPAALAVDTGGTFHCAQPS